MLSICVQVYKARFVGETRAGRARRAGGGGAPLRKYMMPAYNDCQRSHRGDKRGTCKARDESELTSYLCTSNIDGIRKTPFFDDKTNKIQRNFDTN